MNRLLLLGNEKFGIDLFKTLTYSENIKTYVVSEREVQFRRDDDFVKIKKREA